MYSGLINTDDTKCTGCNKCVLKCPTHANEAIINNKQNKIVVNELRCINCGECIDKCDHNARSFDDNTNEFFNDLNKGDTISVIVAPAIRYNIPMYKRLFTYLKMLGVNVIYDVSLGADITTWAYIKAIKEQQLSSVIAQPCPVVVSYIEKFKPSLINYLAPIHSPALCTAIYMNKYKNIRGKIAFLSPCIAKGVEFSDPNTNNLVQYNVTFDNLLKYLQENNVNLLSYNESEFDNIDSSLGLTFSRPGGLKENVYFHMGENIWIRQVEGSEHVKSYLNQYEQRIKASKPIPNLVDILNCEHGCNIGTATTKQAEIDDIDYKTNILKDNIIKQKEDGIKLFQYFDKELNITDFARKYTNRSKEIPLDKTSDIDRIFEELGKLTEEDKTINCFSCGYGSCHDFALAVANGHNHKENCVRYSQIVLNNSLEEFDKLFSEYNSKLKTAEGYVQEFKKSSINLKSISRNTQIISLNASIESANAGKNGAGFGVIASEMRNLAEKSAAVISQNTDGAETIEKQIQELQAELIKIKEKMHETMNVF